MNGTYNQNPAILADELTQKAVTVTTAATELFTGSSRNPKRQHIRLYNDGLETLYFGPAGVTASLATKGEPLLKKQWFSGPTGDVGIFGVTASGTTSIIVTEWA